MKLKNIIVSVLLLSLTACGGSGDGSGDKEEEQTPGKKFDQAIEKAKRKLEEVLEEE